MPRNLFVIELKKREDEVPAAPVVEERASAPVVSPARPMAPPTGRSWPGSNERREQQKQRGPGGDVRRRRSGASRFRG